MRDREWRGRPQPLHAALQVRDLRVAFPYRGGRIQAVEGLSYRVLAGSTLAIIGESGSGKTASCRALMGLLPETALVSGSALLNGRELMGLPERAMRAHRGADIAMVFQDPARSLNPTMRVGHQIVEAMHHDDLDKRARWRRAVELLCLLRVPAPEERFSCYPHELSGGLRQRVLLAIALAGNPKVLIADEATRSLDAITQAETLRLLSDLRHRLSMALIIVSHDLRLAASYADETLVMYAGRAVEYAPTEQLFQHPRMRYTRALLQAAAGLERGPRALFPVIGGHPPDLSAPPPGCPFEPRCAAAQRLCRDERPALQEQGHGHAWACWFPGEGQVDAGHAN